MGAVAEYYGSGDGLAKALATDWSSDRVVVVDLALISTALLPWLEPNGLPVVAFGDPALAGAALGANLADFISDHPTPVELATAFDTALLRLPRYGVVDLSDRSVARLGAFGAEAARIADALARFDMAAASAPLPPLDLARLQATIRARRSRDRFFPPEIFGEPAWDMLLDLAAASVEGRDVAVSSLCIAAAVPTTTALRWIRSLCDAGLFDRRDDPRDARRAFISLSPAGLAAMTRYLAQTPSPWR